jgi:hypothetical protein
MRYVGKKVHPRWLWHAIDHRNLRTRIKRLGAPDDLLFEDRAYARSGYRIARQLL